MSQQSSTVETTETDHAKANAQGWYETMQEQLAAIATLEAGEDDDGNEVESVEIDGDTYTDVDAIREMIQESVLSVEVRDGWKSPGSDGDGPEEFEILLTTGGPALRVRGDLGEHCEPTRAYLQYQDWGTPWTDFYTEGCGKIVLAWASNFWFGD